MPDSHESQGQAEQVADTGRAEASEAPRLTERVSRGENCPNVLRGRSQVAAVFVLFSLAGGGVLQMKSSREEAGMSLKA